MLALRCLDDADTWWHLASGRWIAQHGNVPRTDPFSFTVPDHPWVNVQWLFDLALYGIFQLGGMQLVIVASAIIYGVAIALLVINLRSQVGPVATCLLAVWATCVAQERFMIRPEMVSFVLLPVLWWLLAAAPRTEGRHLWLLPLVMALWANTHSLFIIGVLLIGSSLAAMALVRTRFLPPRWRQSWPLTPTTERRVVLWGTLAVLATLANPYGVEGALFPIKLASRISGANPVFAAINEFRSPFSGYAPSFALAAYHALLVVSIIVVGLAAVLSALRPRTGTEKPAAAGTASFNPAHFLFFVGLAYLSVLARRNIALFAIGATPFVAECLVIVHAALPRALRRACAQAATVLTFSAPPAFALGVWFVVTNGFYRWDLTTHEFGVGVQSTQFPIGAAAFAREFQLPARLYNDLTSGGYLNWDAPVEGGVYIDGRLEVYDAEFFGSYMAAVSDPALWQRDADQRGIATVVLDHRWDQRFVLLKYLLGDPRWALVYYDDVAVVFVRRAGNEAHIDRAQAAFSTRNDAFTRQVLTPVPSWQWPAGRVLSLWNYSNVTMLVGQSDTAAACLNAILSLQLQPPWELQMRLRLADYYLWQGNRELARTHALRAAELSPHNPGVGRLLVQIGS